MTVSQILGALALTWMIALALSVALGLLMFGWLSFAMMFITAAGACMFKDLEDGW